MKQVNGDKSGPHIADAAIVPITAQQMHAKIETIPILEVKDSLQLLQMNLPLILISEIFVWHFGHLIILLPYLLKTSFC